MCENIIEISKENYFFFKNTFLRGQKQKQKQVYHFPLKGNYVLLEKKFKLIYNDYIYDINE